ncbi:uncharacterized protein [Oscarella lobularis]|uniref:uncharacterized protein n=1 Tax=Oscarella lobularis TaxID=121494 RepID=UPI0033140E8B
MRFYFGLLLLTVIPKLDATRVTKLVMLRDAVDSGAVCLDGSPPAYYRGNGTGSDSNKWIIHMEGGGWCPNNADCYDRSNTPLGSSTSYGPTESLSGFLDDDPKLNPKFANWTVIFIKYCDGATYSGNKDDPVVVYGKKLYFRGYRILVTVFEHLLKNGLEKADAAILTGCSAGGESTYIHLDVFRSLVPANIPVHGLPDAGYFINAANVKGQFEWPAQYNYVYHMHNVSTGLNQACVQAKAEDDKWQCFMGQYAYEYLKTPLFVFNSQYDTWQLDYILELGCRPPNCNARQMKHFNAWRPTYLKALGPAIDNPTSGLFIDSCLVHCQSLDTSWWSQVTVNGTSANDAFAQWYFSNGSVTTKEIDKPYPHNPTCT